MIGWKKLNKSPNETLTTDRPCIVMVGPWITVNILCYMALLSSLLNINNILDNTRI